jgi:hypothetical protein
MAPRTFPERNNPKRNNPEDFFLDFFGIIGCLVSGSIGGVPFHQSGNSSKRQFIEWPFHRMHKLI